MNLRVTELSSWRRSKGGEENRISSKFFDGRVSYQVYPELGCQADDRYEEEARPYDPREEEQEYQHKPYKKVY